MATPNEKPDMITASAPHYLQGHLVNATLGNPSLAPPKCMNYTTLHPHHMNVDELFPYYDNGPHERQMSRTLDAHQSGLRQNETEAATYTPRSGATQFAFIDTMAEHFVNGLTANDVDDYFLTVEYQKSEGSRSFNYIDIGIEQSVNGVCLEEAADVKDIGIEQSVNGVCLEEAADVNKDYLFSAIALEDGSGNLNSDHEAFQIKAQRHILTSTGPSYPKNTDIVNLLCSDSNPDTTSLDLPVTQHKTNGSQFLPHTMTFGSKVWAAPSTATTSDPKSVNITTSEIINEGFPEGQSDTFFGLSRESAPLSKGSNAATIGTIDPGLSTTSQTATTKTQPVNKTIKRNKSDNSGHSKTQPSSKGKRTRNMRKKEKTYEQQKPSGNKAQERKWKDAVRAKKCREKQKIAMTSLEIKLKKTVDERDALDREIKVLKQCQNDLFDKIQPYVSGDVRAMFAHVKAKYLAQLSEGTKIDL